MASVDTKERILDAAEQLVAEQGVVGASVRAIASAADVNLASINYHFGSKDSLVQAVLARRVGPVNQERLELLDELESAAGDGPPSTRGLVEAFVRPALRLRRMDANKWRILQRLLGHTISLPTGETRDLFLQQFSEVVQRFTAAMSRALPDLSGREIFWRFFFMVGAMVQTLAMADDMPRFSDDLCGEVDAETTERWLVPFLTAGLAAPPAGAPMEAGDA